MICSTYAGYSSHTIPSLEPQHASAVNVALHLHVCCNPRASTYVDFASAPIKALSLSPLSWNNDRFPLHECCCIEEAKRARQTAIGATGSKPNILASLALGSAQLQSYLVSCDEQSDAPVQTLPHTVFSALGALDFTMSVVSGGARGTAP